MATRPLTQIGTAPTTVADCDALKAANVGDSNLYEACLASVNNVSTKGKLASEHTPEEKAAREAGYLGGKRYKRKSLRRRKLSRRLRRKSFRRSRR